jgi:hypothetical protein
VPRVKGGQQKSSVIAEEIELGRGILSGVFWGGTIAVLGLWMLSQLGGMIHLLASPPEQVVTQAPLPAIGETVLADSGPVVPRNTVTLNSETAQQGGAPDAVLAERLGERLADALPLADQQPASVPVTGS